MHGECLRYQAALEMSEDREWGPAVFPTALKDGLCKYFRKDKTNIPATGFLTSDHTLNDLFVKLCHQLAAYQGGYGTYYLYRNGKKWLS
jgi:hypothetical protein